MNSGNNVLLLGGTGFIGSALAHKLTAEGRQVFIIAPRPPQTTSNALYLQGSLDDPILLAKVLPLCGSVVHLASSTTPGSSANTPTRELDNLAPTLRLLEALQTYPETHLIFFSSGGTLYGNPQRLPVHEDDPTAPLSYHGAGKLAQEALLQTFRSRGHTVSILRPSNAYGPGQELKNGFGLIRTLLEHARRGTAFDIWGDGENVRDFIYIDDLTEACVRLIARPEDSGTYNLGSGVGYSINQVQQNVEEITDTRINTIFHPARGIDVRTIVLNISRVEEKFSWKPETSLHDGVKLAWEWVSQQP